MQVSVFSIVFMAISALISIAAPIGLHIYEESSFLTSSSIISGFTVGP
jgi:hypothetical protein